MFDRLFKDWMRDETDWGSGMGLGVVKIISSTSAWSMAVAWPLVCSSSRSEKMEMSDRSSLSSLSSTLGRSLESAFFTISCMIGAVSVTHCFGFMVFLLSRLPISCSAACTHSLSSRLTTMGMFRCSWKSGEGNAIIYSCQGYRRPRWRDWLGLFIKIVDRRAMTTVEMAAGDYLRKDNINRS